MRTVLDQHDDCEIPIMDAATRTLHARFAASNDNVEPESDEECDGAQLQTVKSKLDADVVPYADFGVIGQRGARFAKDHEVHRTCLGPQHLHIHTKRVQRSKNTR